MAEFKSLRRYALDKRRAAEERGDLAIRDLWKGKQEAEPGTELPTSFPQRARLAELYYTTDADLVGADADELTSVGFSTRDAAAILAAFAELP